MKVELLSGANLAFIGDAYFELWIRHYVIDKGITNLKKCHNETVKYVSREAQAAIVQALYPMLTEQEQDIFKRGRNYHYKDHDEDYLNASGFEAVIGYLHLNKQEERLTQLMHEAIKFIEETSR